MNENTLSYELQYVPVAERTPIQPQDRVIPGTEEAVLIQEMVKCWMIENGATQYDLDCCTPEIILSWIESGAAKMIVFNNCHLRAIEVEG